MYGVLEDMDSEFHKDVVTYRENRRESAELYHISRYVPTELFPTVYSTFPTPYTNCSPRYIPRYKFLYTVGISIGEHILYTVGDKSGFREVFPTVHVMP